MSGLPRLVEQQHGGLNFMAFILRNRIQVIGSIDFIIIEIKGCVNQRLVSGSILLTLSTCVHQ